MQHTIINTAITFVVSSILGYCVSVIKGYKKKIKEKSKNENVQNMALLTLLQSQLTNTYFVYSELKQIPDYMFRNWINLLKVYESLGGNDYVHTLEKKMQTWEITKTDVL